MAQVDLVKKYLSYAVGDGGVSLVDADSAWLEVAANNSLGHAALTLSGLTVANLQSMSTIALTLPPSTTQNAAGGGWSSQSPFGLKLEFEGPVDGVQTLCLSLGVSVDDEVGLVCRLTG